MLFGQNLLCPPRDATANKKKTRNPDSDACHKARKEERNAKGEKYRPCRACWHLYEVSLALFRSAVIHHKSPSDQVNDCKHHDPHCIHEVPIESNDSKPLALPRVNPTEKRKDEDRGKEK